MTEAALILDAPPAIKSCHGGSRPGAGRKPAPCQACGQANQWGIVTGGRRLCQCSPVLPLAQRLADAVTEHLRFYPATTTTDVRQAAAIATAAAAAVLPACQPSRTAP